MLQNKQRLIKIKKIISILIAISIFSYIIPLNNISNANTYHKNNISNGQPISSYWFPNDLLNWSFDKDPDAKYNVSHVPLANRVKKNLLPILTPKQNKDVEVVSISIMNQNTSGNPSQGSNKLNANTFSYWQYIDKLVYWGGSAGEGIIVPPSPDVTDSAHKNGVPVYGTAFFPQNEHGGKLEWLNQFLTKNSDNTFPLADKLIEVAKAYNFDGWFLNQETNGANSEHSKKMQEFIKYFKSKAPNLDIMWYDSMVTNGDIDWQNALTDENKMFLIDGNNNAVADSMFLNFWWNTNSLASKELLKASEAKAKELGLNQYDLYAGIDVQERGYNTPVRWNLFEGNNNNPYTSLGLYCPSWTYFSSSTIEEFLEKESKFWVNEHGNPSIQNSATDKSWKGISTYVVERSAITSAPFNTNFSMGNGKHFFVDGHELSNQAWNNRSINDIMPTYRWIIDNSGNNNIKADIDYSTAYYAGNSISLKGNLNANNYSTIKLYSANLPITNDLIFQTIAKSNKSVNMDLYLEFHDGTNATIVADKPINTNWTKLTYNISQYVNKSIKTISYKLKSSTNIQDIKVNLGNITIESRNQKPVVNVTKVDKQNEYIQEGLYGGVRISIKTNSTKENINHYEIYRIINSEEILVGVTTNPDYYVGNLKRNGKETSSTFNVYAINKSNKYGYSAKFTLNWGDYPTPKADFNISSTFINPGESINLTNLSSETTESVEWHLPGADSEFSTEFNPSVKYSKEGVYNITLTAKNSSGQDVMVKNSIITVKKHNPNDIVNLSLNKKATASSFVNDKEAPQFALDGDINTKWCAVGDGPHSITIDLMSDQNNNLKDSSKNLKSMITSIGIDHAGAGGENSGFNTKGYTISTSNDGINFTDILTVTDNNKNSTMDNIPVTDARYVRLNIDKATQGGDKATRIYEIKVMGYQTSETNTPPITEYNNQNHSNKPNSNITNPNNTNSSMNNPSTRERSNIIILISLLLTSIILITCYKKVKK